MTSDPPGVQQLGAAVQGIESQLADTVRVKSLQDHARDLGLYARTADQA